MKKPNTDFGGIVCLGFCLAAMSWLFVRPALQASAEREAIEKATAECVASGKYEDRHWTVEHEPERLNDNLQVVSIYSGVITAEDQCRARARAGQI